MDKTDPIPDAAPLGMILFLASLAVLFASSMVGFAIVAHDAEQWPPPGMPALPPGLWVATAILLVSSGTVHWAQRSARLNRPVGVQAGLAATTALAVAFVACQLVVWWELVNAELTVHTNLYGFSFYMLTALHGLHVIAGVIPLVVTTVRAFLGAYTPERHNGVKLVALYWHFLDGTWLVIVAFLQLYM